MVEKRIFVREIGDLLNYGASEKGVIDYVKSLGVDEKEAKSFLAEAKKGTALKAKSGVRVKPLTMEEQAKRFEMQKTERGKAQFKENIEELSKIMTSMQKDLKKSQAESG